MDVTNKVVIITGAGTGIGKKTALLLASKGAKIVATDIDEDNVKQTEAEIRQAGKDAISIQHDITNEKDWEKVARTTIETYGRVDVLFNNAGIFSIKPLIETDLEEWKHMMNINVTGPFLGMKHIIPLMIENEGGSIINASSNAGLFGASGISLYSATKGAVRILTKSAAMEYGEYGIRINSIHPGYIKTQMIEYAADVANKDPEDQGKLVPLKRLGTTDDVANLVLYLASDSSSYVTGAELVVDGGVSAGQSVWEEEN